MKRTELKVLTYNIAGLPPYINRNEPRTRLSLLASILSKDASIDVILFQEAFDWRVIKLLREGLRDNFPYIVENALPNPIYCR